MDPISLALMGGTALASIFGASKQASAAKDAARMQADASAASLAMQERLYQQARSDNAPRMAAGNAALGALSSRFGVGAPSMTGGTPVAPEPASYQPYQAPAQTPGERYLAANPDLAAEWARIQGRDERFRTADDYVNWHKANFPNEARPEGAPEPADTNGQVYAQPDPSPTPATDEPSYAYDPTVANTGGYVAPSRENYTVANASLPGFDPTIRAREEFRPLDVSADAYRKSPGYDFQLSEGLKAVNAGMAGAGKLMSGQRMKALQERGQGIADQDYGAWRAYETSQYNLDRGRGDAIYDSDRAFTAIQGNLDRSRGDALYAADRGYAADRYDTQTAGLMSLAGLGSQATAANQGAAQSFGQAYGASMTGAANAQASGQINAANAWANAGNNLMTTGAYLYGQGAFGAKPPGYGSSTYAPKITDAYSGQF